MEKTKPIDDLDRILDIDDRGFVEKGIDVDGDMTEIGHDDAAKPHGFNGRLTETSDGGIELIDMDIRAGTNLHGFGVREVFDEIDLVVSGAFEFAESGENEIGAFLAAR